MNNTENRIWDSFTDKLDREKFINEGVAYLERWYTKNGEVIKHHIKYTDNDDTVIPLPLIAKGISAYLSFWPYSDYKSLRILLYENKTIDLDEIFARYFNNCYRFLDISNRMIALPHKRKSKSDLIIEHLKIEEQYLLESEPLFFECKLWEKNTISEIKEVALFYPEWVTKAYLKNEVQVTSPDISMQTKGFTVPSKEAKNFKKEIEQKLCFMQKIDMRKHERILNDADFNKLVEWLTYFFDNGFTIPDIDNQINKVNTAKGNVLYAIISLFDDLYPDATRPDALYELIIKCFYQYRNDKISNLRKSTKKPQFFDDLIKR